MCSQITWRKTKWSDVSAAGRKLLAPLRQQARADDATQRRDGLDEEHQTGEERNRAVVHHNRAAAASERNAFGFARVGEPGLENANAHIKVAVAKTTTDVDALEDAAARRKANARL